MTKLHHAIKQKNRSTGSENDVTHAIQLQLHEQADLKWL